MAHTKNHDYHILAPSLYPLLGAVSAFVMLYGAVLWMKHDSPWMCLIGFVGVLSAIFTGFQAYEYRELLVVDGWSLSGEIAFANFFMATGFHGFHVIVGTIFLTVCLLRVLKNHFKSDDHVGFEAAAWYWHFVDVVWLFLFASVYLWAG